TAGPAFRQGRAAQTAEAGPYDCRPRDRGNSGAARVNLSSAEFVAALEVRPIRKVPRRNALASFESNLLKVEATLLPARNQNLAPRHGDRPRQFARARTVAGPSPKMAKLPAKRRVRAGPRLEPPNAVVNLTCGEAPVDAAAFLLQRRRERRMRMILRMCVEFAAFQSSQRA